jgi:hypothetical protein
VPPPQSDANDEIFPSAPMADAIVSSPHPSAAGLDPSAATNTYRGYKINTIGEGTGRSYRVARMTFSSLDDAVQHLDSILGAPSPSTT